MNKLQKYLLVGASASTTLASASVVYTDVDPDVYLNSDGENFNLDFNGDGTNEFQILFEINGFGGGWGGGVDVYEPKIQGLFGNQIAGYYLNAGWGNPILPASFVYPYYSGAAVTSNLDWGSGSALFGYYFNGQQGTQSRGQWAGNGEEFAALKFSLNGNIHYGWVRCIVDYQYQGITILDYGYNDTPDAAALTGSTYDINYVANNIIAADVSNFANGLDLQVSFNKATTETGISEYRIMAVKSALADDFSVGDANSNSFYKSIVPNGQDITTIFNEFSKDSDGDYIVEDTTYKIFVLSVPDLDSLYSSNLPEPSNEVRLSSETSLNESLWDNFNIIIKNGKLSVNSKTTIDQLTVVDLTGKILYQNWDNSLFNIDLSFTKGTYIIQLQIGNIIECKKIII